MPRRNTSILVAVCAVLLLGGAALILFSTATDSMSETPTPSSRAENLPTVRAAVGTDLRRMQAASSFAFDFSGRLDDAVFVVEEPVVFTYGGEPVEDSLSFSLPPTRFLGISQVAGVVHSVQTTPQLQFADLDGAYQLAQQIAERIDATAWPHADNRVVTEAEVRRLFTAPETRETARISLRQWRVGNVEMDLTLKRRFVAGSNRAQAAGVEDDSYLVELMIVDIELDMRMAETMYERRRAAGDENTPLPLSVWLDEQP